MNSSQSLSILRVRAFTLYVCLILTPVVFLIGCTPLPPMKPCPSSTSAVASTRYAQRQPPQGVEPVVLRSGLVQANVHLFDSRRSCDHAALVVFSLDPGVSDQDLISLGRKLFQLKGSPVIDPDERPLAEEITDEQYHPDRFVTVPASLGGSGKTYVADVWIDRKGLSANYIRGDTLLTFYVYFVEGVPYTSRFIADK